MKLLQLNASTLPDPNSLCIPLKSDNSVLFPILIDSGSSHCFIDPQFTLQYLLFLVPIPSIKLELIDGTISDSIINQTLKLPVKFPSSKCMTISLFMFLLDLSTPLVLGYNWLICYNPLIDWVLGSTIFCPQLLEKSNPSLTSFVRSAQLPSHQHPYSDVLLSSASTLTISMIDSAAFLCACKLPGAQSF